MRPFKNGGKALDFLKAQLKYGVVVKVLLLQRVRSICVQLGFTLIGLFTESEVMFVKN